MQSSKNNVLNNEIPIVEKEKDEIEWQSLQSYYLNSIPYEDIEIEIEPSIRRGNFGNNESEVGDIGCTDHIMHGHIPHMAALMQGAEDFIRKVWKRGWGLVQHQSLPHWLKDNNFLVRSHRPELNSYADCFRSIFRLHTETVNIWTHLLGWIAFIAMALTVLAQTKYMISWQDKAVNMCFFMGAILCLGFSWLFHTVYCHSQKVGKIFNKLDYCGIAFLTVGSFIPWLYYSFYCSLIPKIVYVCLILVLGCLTIAVSMVDKFATPTYRSLRAALFISLGLSGAIPCLHYVIVEGFWAAVYRSSLGWLSLMALLYITGAVIYAVRIPERFNPGRFDILFQSHQIFHVFVVAAALVHYYGIVLITKYRLTEGDCHNPTIIQL